MAPSSESGDIRSSHSVLEARLKERHAAAPQDYKKVFGYLPSRWLQMEREHGTLRACHMILTESLSDPDGWATQLEPMWEKGRLVHSVESVALEAEFAPLFTDAERAVYPSREHRPGSPVEGARTWCR